MSAVVFLLIACLGSAVAYVRTRAPSSVESGIDDFQREMRALAPRPEGRRETWKP